MNLKKVVLKKTLLRLLRKGVNTMTPQELNELNSAIAIISDRSLKVKHNIPYIYTTVVDSINADGRVIVQFPEDVSSGKRKMTFRNMSGYIPVKGQGAYVLTTGSDNLTGGFIIAIQGQPSLFINQLADRISILENNYTALEARVKALEDKNA